jgi:ankyrin repeat protein
MEPETRKSQTRGAYMVVGDLFLTMALRDGAALLQAIAASGVDVNVADPSGKTLLLHAVRFAAQPDGKLRRRMVEGITCLLDHGADPNLADDQGQTPFTAALKLGQKNIAELLLLSGAKFRSRVQYHSDILTAI